MDEHLHKYQAYKNLKRILRYLSPYSIMFSILVVLSVFYLFIDLVKPLLYGYFFSSLYNQDPQLSAKVIFFWVIANTLATGIRWGKSTISSVIQNNILVDVRKEIFSKLLNIPLTKFKQLGAGRFITLLYSDASIICNILNERLINTIFSLLSLIVIGIIIFKTSWMLGIIVLTFSPILFTIFVYWGKVLKERGREYKLWEDGYVFRIQHFIQGIEEIKGMGIKERIYDLFVVSTVEIRKRRLALSKSSINAQPFISLSNMIQYVLMMSLGAYLIHTHSLSIELFIAFLSYSDRFTNSLMGVSSLNAELQQTLVSAERMFNLLDTDDENGISEKITINDPKGQIQFRNVSFSYDNTRFALKDITFTAKPYSVTAIIGKSGSGKSTILSLIQTLYKPQRGEISIDNVDINKLRKESIGQVISIVKQEPFLFNMTIRENFRLIKSDITDEEIHHFCSISYIHNEILDMPKGYDTLMEPDSRNISVGQKQRIAIARALARGTKIILFDEITSALDNESQYYICKTIKEISNDHTVIMIEHKLATISSLASQIIFLDSGKIEALGSHDHLMQCNAEYRKLYYKGFDA